MHKEKRERFKELCELAEVQKKLGKKKLGKIAKEIDSILAGCGKIVRSQQFLGWFKSLGSFRAFAA